MQKAFVSLVLVLAAMLASSCACDSEQTRNEAMLFLTRVQDFDVDDDIEERRRVVDSIRDLALTDPTVIAARDTCVTAYSSLLEAEDEHARARHLLVGTFLPDGGEQPIGPEMQAQIEGALDHSGEALERSQEMIPRCTRAVGQLERQFPHRHAE